MLSGILRTAGSLATYIANQIAIALNTIDVDKQTITATNDVFTTSATYVDMPNMTATTKNLGQPGKYHFRAVCEVTRAAGNGNTAFNAILNIDGTDLVISEVDFTIATAGTNQTVIVSGYSDSLAASKVVKVRWKGAAGTLHVINRTLFVDGTPLTQVAP